MKLILTAAVDHLGYVQIDTINVIERCHHHILFTRIPDYRRADLKQAQSADKSVFEYWTHALSYVPSKDINIFLPAMKAHKREGHKWFSSVTPADTRKVLRLLREGVGRAYHTRQTWVGEGVQIEAWRRGDKAAPRIAATGRTFAEAAEKLLEKVS